MALDPYTTHGQDGVVRNGYVVNDESMSRLVEQTARDVLGPENVHTNEPPSMGVEEGYQVWIDQKI